MSQYLAYWWGEEDVCSFFFSFLSAEVQVWWYERGKHGGGKREDACSILKISHKKDFFDIYGMILFMKKKKLSPMIFGIFFITVVPIY